MKKYEVTLCYHTRYTVVVEAENEKDALEEAYNKDLGADDVKVDYQEDGEPEIELVNKI